ncbi:Crp/Fnr family transcriptional regulator [Mesorhizobium sp. M1C.F.Ca.ET.193.01.1.1]|uniref:Crp/Fnr family transcriptional regulator n=1 Tax=unclassified Mesorhizobium TaxID=325217 RepID=UPI000FD512F5|nr:MULTISPECIES: Crp/Fnr family transcriptional regulator [unclassified Mesorhizobium]TGT01439.1 Crp/Fnr family transcriptional regulator [bacterium M00.F.Ca.ET.177.01.1.1]TGQ54198.1 Crp/Fnr family transcriptional regulator [Mesorhizobium sp. M1C.F.Ca.ET.210.01.1.1]TGQ72211.1 Crp/Fnr family transcriptional regulator [Mesorhizobium sp. M1C.F.Ca.ET.212.01.1.1]TGR10027.1 Crp/Fnr family transcriptional regulator [Mesorhizobium sp. M1C.F.Ca.ET.204.01.1.1]TGR30147.1 Crp/Fnr family transcriptional re
MSYRTKNEVRIAGLLAASIFGDLDHSRLVEIAQAAHEYRYEPGQLIFQPGDPCNQLSIIASGSVNVSFNSEDGKEVIVAELGVGDTIGETELLSNSRRLTNCVATRKTHLLALDKPTFEGLLPNAAFTRGLLETICRRLQQSLLFAEGLSIHSLETRLARLLLSMSETHGRRVGDGVIIDRAISQTLIGQMINASRPRINIQLQSWKHDNLIRLSRNRITILDEGAIRSISRSPLAER